MVEKLSAVTRGNLEPKMSSPENPQNKSTLENLTPIPVELYYFNIKHYHLNVRSFRLLKKTKLLNARLKSIFHLQGGTSRPYIFGWS